MGGERKGSVLLFPLRRERVRRRDAAAEGP